MRIVIIGAGVLGASAAFHLARAGAQVTVIDANLDGRATAAGAGIICPWVSGVEDQAFYRLYAGGGEYYPDLVAALAEAGETDFGYRRTGAMLVSGDPQELAWIERMARQRAAAAMGDDHAPVRARGAGVVSTAAGRALAASLCRAALGSMGGVWPRRCCARLGSPVIQGHAALAVEANRVVGVDVGSERIPADRVIVTAGAWVGSRAAAVRCQPAGRTAARPDRASAA